MNSSRNDNQESQHPSMMLGCIFILIPHVTFGSTTVDENASPIERWLLRAAGIFMLAFNPITHLLREDLSLTG